MKEEFYAHSLEGRPESEWQTLKEHLRNVAELAAGFAKAFGAEKWAYAAGLWHDLGKCSKEFQQRLRAGPKVDHATAGAQYAVGHFSSWGRMLAYALAGHHGGLPNGWGGEGTTLEKRLKKNIPAFQSCEINEFDLPESLPFQISRDRFSFEIAFFIRMVFSCLVDADFLDTERFVDSQRYAQRLGYPDISELSARFFPPFNKMVEEARLKRDSKVNRIRRQVLDQCLEKAASPPGLFSLTVPTGGGKTLSSLAFALKHVEKHAEKHGLRRIIYVIPYMSIIEQNAEEFRKYLGKDGVLEHHSSFDFDVEDKDEGEVNKRAKLASENWDAPLVATTAVQFFESLFSNKPSRCRKLHNVAESVVILDEAQMLPRELLLPCIEAIRELVSHYRTTVVLCTATQPALEKRDGFPGLDAPCEIIADPAGLYEDLRRVTVEHLGALSDKDLAETLSNHEQCLCIVNTRKHARTVYELLKAENDVGVFHLSANMCPAHRSAKLAQIKAGVEEGRPSRVVSTSLIEAGVDASWPFVYRAAAGIDSIAQAAGRCDREGELTAKLGALGGKVYVFEPESGLPPGNFRITAQVADEVMRHHPDILGHEAVRAYFEHLFWKASNKLDAKNILGLLAKDAAQGNFPFNKISELFQVIQDGQKPVIIPWDEHAAKQVKKLRYVEFPGGILRSLQAYTVQVSPGVLRDLRKAHVVEFVEPVAKQYPVLINMDIYSEELGLCPEDPTFRKIESNMI